MTNNVDFVLIFRPIKTANKLTTNILTNVCVGMLIFTSKKRRIYFFIYYYYYYYYIYIFFFFSKYKSKNQHFNTKNS